MKTTITRDTNTSFFKVITNASGAEFSRKLEKGTSEYSNACADFHKNNVEIAIGNSITE
jgi:hypothetical protein